jgi:PAS domain S-box-containing protein
MKRLNYMGKSAALYSFLIGSIIIIGFLLVVFLVNPLQNFTVSLLSVAGLIILLAADIQVIFLFHKILQKPTEKEVPKNIPVSEIGEAPKEEKKEEVPFEQPISIIDKDKLRYAAILAYIGEGLVVIDKSGKIISFNKAAESLLGWTAQEAIGQNLTDIFTIDYQSSIEENKHAIGRKSTLFLVRKDKTKFPAAINTTSYGHGLKIFGTITLFRDVTAEQNNDKMKNDFISLASHQLRTPLAAIKWYANMLLSGDAGKLLPEQQEYADNIYVSTERMIELVTSLLNITRIESGRIIVEPKPTELEALIEDLVKEVKIRYVEKKQRFSVNVQGVITEINIDPRLIRQVFLNLLTNSAKYTPDNGEITVTISKTETDIITEVKDTGFGIPIKEQDKVFDKFYRGENMVSSGNEGTGLGLYMVKDIIDLSQGKIWFKSQEGHGTSFWVSLPIAGTQPKKGVIKLET